MRTLIRNLSLAASLLVGLFANATAPVGYYSSINGKSGSELRQALYEVICNQTIPESYSSYYSALPEKFRLTDVVPGTTQWWDMYSSDVNSSEAFTNMNREHALPKSWWGSDDHYPAYIDLNHLYPAESSINQSKSNWPLGKVLVRNTDNGVSRVGSPCIDMGGSAASVFEPADEYKGDFARTYFYMALRYYDAAWDSKYPYMIDTDSEDTFQPWAVKMLLEWAAADPVSEKEINRNDAVYSIQNNRNPFIDHPELLKYIWGSKKGEVYYVEGAEEANTDHVTTSLFGFKKTSSYMDVEAETDKAYYHGNLCMASDTYALQMRATNSSCLIAQGKDAERPLKALTVTWNDATASSRTLKVYLSNDPITQYSDIESLTPAMTIKRSSGNARYDITGNYTYVALVAAGGAIYMDSLAFQWGDASASNSDDDDEEEEDIHHIATFNFSESETLNPSIARDDIGQDGYSVNNLVFTDGKISVSFKKVASTNCRLYLVGERLSDCRIYTKSQVIVQANDPDADVDIQAINLTKNRNFGFSSDDASGGSIDDNGLWTHSDADVIVDKVTFTATATSYLYAIEVKYTAFDDNATTVIANKIDNTNAPVEYYNLQGVRVNSDNLNTGIYIRRQGTNVEKVLIK